MAFDKTAASGVLKEFYLPAVREQLNNRNEYEAQLEKSGDNFDSEGEEVVLSLHVNRNPGIGSRGELEDLPAPGSQSYVKARVPVKHHYGQIQISGPVMRATLTDSGSWLRALESEQAGVINDLRRDHERQLLGTSNGVIAQCGVTSAATAVVTTATDTQIRQLRVGDIIDIGTVAAPTTVASARTITAISGTTVTISGAAVTTTASHFIFRTGNGGIASGVGQKEVTGVQSIVASSGTLFEVDPTSYPEWTSSEVAASAAAISVPLIEELLDEIDIVSPVGTPDWGFTTHRQARVLAATLTSNRRYVNEMELKGGFTGLEVATASGTIGVSTLRDCPVQTFYAVNTAHMSLNQQSDWEFMEEDGSVLSRIVTGNGKDGYGATLFKYDEQTTDVRSAHGLISGLAA